MNLFDLSGEVAVVIGGTGALGGAVARSLAEAGATVAIVGRNRERGEAIAREIQGHAQFFAGDAVSRQSISEAHCTIHGALGAPTILVNAAGGNDPSVTVTPDLPVDRIEVDAWKNSFDLNLVGGALIPSQEFGRSMCERRKGSIINIASVSAHIPLSRVVAYSAAKAAVLSLTQFLAREWATQGVRVNSITPGFFPADQNRRLLYDEAGNPTPRAQSILGHTPMHRFGEPTELGGAAVFLAASRASGFVTGIDLRVDGGFLSQTI